VAELVLKPGREKSLLRRHPWIFSGAVQQVDGNPASGETVDLLSFKGDFLARAAYSPHSQIRARVWTFDPDEQVDSDLFRKRIQFALATRRTLNVAQFSDAYRLVYAESDSLPGLIVDRYGDVLVLQSLTAGSEFWKETLADILLERRG
jgi:23S rRNA (cytosine1962-C5)-methyltransferase